MDVTKSFTFTKEIIEKYKEKEAKMTPEERQAANKAFVEANNEANMHLCRLVEEEK